MTSEHNLGLLGGPAECADQEVLSIGLYELESKVVHDSPDHLLGQ